MIRRTLPLAALAFCWSLLFSLSAAAQDGPEPYFSLSTQQTYMPGEKPEVALYSHNVRELEFRESRFLLVHLYATLAAAP